MEKNQYYSLVSDRISELENELESLMFDYNNETDVRVRNCLELEISVIKEKIKYLKDIELLPMYVALYSFKNIKIFDKITKEEVPFIEVQHRLGLDKVREVMSRSKVTTLSYLKELFINDYQSMKDLLDLQGVNFMCSERVRDLYNNGENSIVQIGIRERQFSRLEVKTNLLISELERDYSFDTLKEINHYMRNDEEKLSVDFILKHQDKVISKYPEMAKMVKKLSSKDKFRFVTKFFKNKRNKNEEKFLNSVLEVYKNDNRLNSLGLSSSEDLLNNSNTIKKFIKKLNKKIASKKNDLNETRDNLSSARNSVMNEIRYYEALREDKKKSLISLLKSKTNFLPKMFGEQLWNEPCLKDSLIKVSCFDEENKLLDKISNSCTSSTQVIEETLDMDIKMDINVKKLTA